MKTSFLFIILFINSVFGHYNGILSRNKRDNAGALEIVTNNAQPIHADVKNDYTGLTEKPCPKTYIGHIPSNIESGVVFQVTPPKNNLFDGKSLRKSLPLTSKLDLVRAVSRVTTLIVLTFSAIMEFYPVVQFLYGMIYEFINIKH